MGFEEIAHTADWSVRVWGDDLPSLFAESARAMNTLAGVETVPGPRVRRVFESDGVDAESLLVSFLSELIYFQEQENLAFDVYNVQVSNGRVAAEMEGAEIQKMDKAIKAVTFHDLRIEQLERGYETTLVFDV